MKRKQQDHEERKRKCGRKIRYLNSSLAAEAAANLMRWNPSRHVSEYKCPFCPYWHIGHTPYELRPENAPSALRPHN